MMSESEDMLQILGDNRDNFIRDGKRSISTKLFGVKQPHVYVISLFQNSAMSIGDDMSKILGYNWGNFSSRISDVLCDNKTKQNTI